MTATTRTDHTPRAWLGSLAAYNAGHLIGDWYPASEVADVTVADLHRGTDVPYTDDDELWIFDHESIPVSGEMDPMTAAAWGALYDEVGDAAWPALCAYVRSGSYVAQGDSDLPVVSAFEDAYAGEWESFEDYAHQLAEDAEVFSNVPEELRTYIDMRAWARDIEADYSTETTGHGGVFVFRNH
ncbi:antirestriction protein ArdA [Rhodococcus erythropolis]